jgi:hypothetical protein
MSRRSELQNDRLFISREKKSDGLFIIAFEIVALRNGELASGL